MRNYLLNIGGMVAGAAVIAAVSTGFQKDPNAVVMPESPAIAAPANPELPAPVDNPNTPQEPTLTPVNDPDVISEDITPSEDITYYAADQDFVLINERSIPMDYFQASPTDIDDWENNILGDSTLLPGESVVININDSRESCLYDFRAGFEDDSALEAYEIDICELSSYTFD